jgi:hypothetical protein
MMEMAGMNGDLLVGLEKMEIPLHPLFFDAEIKSLRELIHVQRSLFSGRKMRQPNRQIAEILRIRIEIAPGAPLGTRELRIVTPRGLTAPRNFVIDHLPEVLELEPNSLEAYEPLPTLGKDSPVPPSPELPVVLNGQILPGDVDRFRVLARGGQNLVIHAQARSLTPYLADAVPGWFQATLTLYDSQGVELAYQDDNRFDPDPVIRYRVPEDGEVEVKIQDAIYRGREDFVYRIRVSEEPLPGPSFPLRARGANDAVARSMVGLPVVREEPDQASGLTSQRVRLPVLVDGRISRREEVDRFRFRGHMGQELVVEVFARRLGSSLDSLLRLVDPGGKVLAWNDDQVDKEGHLHRDASGLLTHHADSYLRAKLERDGDYLVEVSDAQHHGGEGYGYRLRLSTPRPDFRLRVTPSSLLGRAGEFLPIRVHVLRQDGFQGGVRISLLDAPGFELQGGRIPPGRKSVSMTLKTPHGIARGGSLRVFSLHFQGKGEVAGRSLIRPAVPAENTMQAFLYRHLPPSQELVLVVDGTRRRAPPLRRTGNGPVRLRAGGVERVHFRFPGRKKLDQFQLELADPPPGVTLGPLVPEEKGAQFEVRLGEDALEVGFRDNLIVQVFREFTPKKGWPGKGRPGKGKKKRKATPGKRRNLVGFLPAIPFQVIGKESETKNQKTEVVTR